MIEQLYAAVGDVQEVTMRDQLGRKATGRLTLLARDEDGWSGEVVCSIAHVEDGFAGRPLGLGHAPSAWITVTHYYLDHGNSSVSAEVAEQVVEGDTVWLALHFSAED